jgi:hypothetical protein
MLSRELISEIARRSRLPHDEVALVLDTLRAVIREQLGSLRSVILPKMMVISANYYPSNRSWEARVSLYRELTDAVGVDLIRPRT